MINYLITWLFAVAPFSEVRGAILYGLGAGLDSGVVLTTSIFFNCLIVPFLFWILKLAHFREFVLRLFGKKTSKIIKKNRRKFEIYKELALFAFVAIPLPFTGAYTGTLIASLLGLNEKRSMPVIFLGIITAALIVFYSAQGILFIIK